MSNQVSERELYIILLDGISKAREAARGLGHKRGDMRWIKVAGMFDQCQDNVKKLFDRAQGNRGIIN